MKLNAIEFLEFVKNAVLKGEFPRYIYKYHRIDEHTQVMFVESYLWFSNPQNFNDPFDCQIVVDTNNTAQEIENWMRASYLDHLSKGHFISMMATAIADQPDQWHSIVNDTITQHTSKIGVCCFAECPDDILMWSHYGKSHTGYCMKFAILEDIQFFSLMAQVNYQDDYPVSNYIKEKDEFIKKALLTKAQCWSYERERRIISLDKQGKVPLKRSALVEVIFGSRCSSSDINNIRKYITDNKYKNVGFKKAVVSQTEYKLILHDII